MCVCARTHTEIPTSPSQPNRLPTRQCIKYSAFASPLLPPLWFTYRVNVKLRRAAVSLHGTLDRLEHWAANSTPARQLRKRNICETYPEIPMIGEKMGLRNKGIVGFVFMAQHLSMALVHKNEQKHTLKRSKSIQLANAYCIIEPGCCSYF